MLALEVMIGYKQIENLKINNTRSIFTNTKALFILFFLFTSFLIYSSTLATVQLEYKVQDAYTGLCEREKKTFWNYTFTRGFKSPTFNNVYTVTSILLHDQQIHSSY